ncbi:MAG: hypothetical protein LBP22_05935 [Deltaproteobacteria bacterium]|jgi:hypothetical protein|nr:hypothetical protein [Deltaproteobacteria bacterium]
MDQTEKNRYALTFQDLNSKIYKTALAITGRSDVPGVFEEAENRTLESDPSENFCGAPYGRNLLKLNKCKLKTAPASPVTARTKNDYGTVSGGSQAAAAANVCIADSPVLMSSAAK